MSPKAARRAEPGSVWRWSHTFSICTAAVSPSTACRVPPPLSPCTCPPRLSHLHDKYFIFQSLGLSSSCHVTFIERLRVRPNRPPAAAFAFQGKPPRCSVLTHGD